MYDISGTGVSVRVVASKSFPSGFTITEFADDADPFDFPAMDIAEVTMNINGDPVFFSSPKPLQFTLNAIPDSDADKNLAVIFEANRVGKNKIHVGDEITIVGTYPNGSTITLASGKMTNGMPGNSPSSAGRLKSKAYSFAFGSLARTRS